MKMKICPVQNQADKIKEASLALQLQSSIELREVVTSFRRLSLGVKEGPEGNKKDKKNISIRIRKVPPKLQHFIVTDSCIQQVKCLTLMLNKNNVNIYLQFVTLSHYTANLIRTEIIM